MRDGARERVDKLIGKFADDLADKNVFTMFAKPKTNAWYECRYLKVYLTTGWYMNPEKTTQWVICISNVSVPKGYQREGIFKHTLIALEQLAKQYQGRIRVENVGNRHLAKFLKKRGYVVSDHDGFEKAKTHWQGLGDGQQTAV